MKYLVAILAISIAIGAVGLQAQMMSHMMGLPDELKLTEAQAKQMQANFIAEEKDLVQLKADFAKTRIEMKELMMADNVDKTAVMKKFDQVSAAKAAIAKRKLGGKLDRMNILTPEQRQKCGGKPMMMGKGKCGRGCFGKGMKEGMGCGMGMKEGGGQEMGKCPNMGHPVNMPDESGKTKDKE